MVFNITYSFHLTVFGKIITLAPKEFKKSTNEAEIKHTL